MIGYSLRAQDDLNSLADRERCAQVLTMVEEARFAMNMEPNERRVHTIADRARTRLRQFLKPSQYFLRDYHRADTAISHVQLQRSLELRNEGLPL